MMKEHILVISQYFYPEEFRINDICREWVKRGHQVTVVTGIPNYPQGRFLKGYGWFRRRKECYEGVRIIRLPIIPRGKNPLMLVFNYFSFVISGFFWKSFTGVRADQVFIFEVSPMTQALVGVWYAKRRKIPCCIYVQDLWPENVEAAAGVRNRRILGCIDKMADYIYRNCDMILATSQKFVQRIEERKAAFTESGDSKVKFWPQYAEEFYQPAEKKPLADLPEDGIFKIVFTGNVGYAQGLDILPDTAVKLQEKGIRCRFVLIGDGRYREELEKSFAAKGVSEMFCLLGRKAREEIPFYLAACNVAFISFADNPLFSMTIPAKLQSYMACGMPILAVADGETKRIVEEAGCGWVVPMGDAALLSETIQSIMKDYESVRSDMGQNALAYYRTNFDKMQLLDQMEKYWSEHESV